MSIESAKAFNAAFGYTFPKEPANPEIETCKDALRANTPKAMMCVPIVKNIVAGGVMSAAFGKLADKVKWNAHDKALFARAVISSTSAILLVIFDIFVTIFVKPFINLAICCHNRKVTKEKEAAKLLEETKRLEAERASAQPEVPTTQVETTKLQEVVFENRPTDDAEEVKVVKREAAEKEAELIIEDLTLESNIVTINPTSLTPTSSTSTSSPSSVTRTTVIATETTL